MTNFLITLSFPFTIRYNNNDSKGMCAFMDYEFDSLLELFKRVQPALRVKKNEFQREFFSSVKVIDIWNCLIEEKWKTARGLMLSDIVRDILNISYNQIENYLKKRVKNQDTQTFENVEIIRGEET